ncbi:MAG TPA: GspH/FimT family pseudopilin [Nitrospira sp.]|nr:GspH/FimT family pseudopilin [Nitrospira sp.]
MAFTHDESGVEPKGYRAGSSQGGFTLIEMAIAVVVIGLLAAMAAPNLIQWVQHYQLNQATSTLASRLQGARATAINQNRPIIVNICLYPNAPCNTTAPPTGAGSVQAIFSFPGGAAALPVETLPSRVVNFNLPQAGPITFNSRGMSSPAVTQTVQLLTAQTGYSVTVNPMGKVSWCTQVVAACP